MQSKETFKTFFCTTDTSTLVKGQKLGCSYIYNNGALGEFSELSLAENTACSKIKDPLTLFPSSLEMFKEPLDLKTVKQDAAIEFQTKIKYSATKYALGSGSVTETEYIDFNAYKEILSLDQMDFIAEVIPNDVLFINKELLDISDFEGINGVAVSMENLYCKILVTANGKEYYYYDFEAERWMTADLNDYAAVKEKGIDAQRLQELHADEWKRFSEGSKLGFAFLLGINGKDIAKKYRFHSYSIDYIGESAMVSTKQEFNFVYLGKNAAEEMLFVADRIVQTEISYNTLNASKIGSTGADLSFNEFYTQVYARIISNKEYEELILGTNLSDNPRTFWNTKVKTLTSTVSFAADNDGTAAAANRYAARGGLKPEGMTNVLNTAIINNVGFRPVLTVNLNSKSQKKPSCTFALDNNMLHYTLTNPNEYEQMKYRIYLNDVLIGTYNDFENGPIARAVELPVDKIKYNVNNFVTVKVKNSSERDTEYVLDPFSFIGSCYGVLFCDADEKFYTNSFGDIISLMKINPLVQTKTTPSQEVYVLNKTNMDLSKIVVEAVYPEDQLGVELSDSNSSFTGEHIAAFLNVKRYEKRPLYARITAMDGIGRKKIRLIAKGYL